jgi:crotonobetainyl-CoA:carnitine CoA-transferase CaiB-like acyl-CoA transferase
LLGQDTLNVLRDLGYTDEQFADFEKRGVV